MKLRKPLSCLSLVASFSIFAIGCGGSDSNAQAKNPTDTVESTTTTTGSQMGPAPNGQDSNMQPQAGQTSPAPNPQPATDTGAGMPGKDPASLSDGDIAAITDATNNGEIEQAKLALKKTKNAKVKKLAQMMLDDHQKAVNDQNSVVQKASITPSSNTLSRQMIDDGSTALSTLQNDTGKEFDSAYVDLQVNEHRQVLQTLDQKLIPNAQNADLKSALQTQRAKVAEHLKHAEDLQKQMGGGSSGSMPSTTKP